jgi:ketosteroid isomerase-like protein
VTFQDKVRLLSDLYRAFNRRELDRVLAALSPNVRWPNVLERTELRGHAAIRSYWLEQFETIEPRVEPVEFEERPEGVAVRVRQVVTVKATGQVSESSVTHTYAFDEGLVASMVVS